MLLEIDFSFHNFQKLKIMRNLSKRLHFFMVFIPGTFVKMLNYFSIVSHFNSVARGIIDTRDVIYFITLIAVFIIAAIHVQEKRRK